jgi:AbrB family looped-hinge helix DNA binding protein
VGIQVQVLRRSHGVVPCPTDQEQGGFEAVDEGTRGRRIEGMAVRSAAYLGVLAMFTTVLSSKGQVIIPKALRAAQRWGPGTELEVHETPEGILLRPVAPKAKVSLASGLAAIRSRIGYSGPVVSLAEMDAGVLREAALRAGTPAAALRAARKPSC